MLQSVFPFQAGVTLVLESNSTQHSHTSMLAVLLRRMTDNYSHSGVPRSDGTLAPCREIITRIELGHLGHPLERARVP